MELEEISILFSTNVQRSWNVISPYQLSMKVINALAMLLLTLGLTRDLEQDVPGNMAWVTTTNYSSVISSLFFVLIVHFLKRKDLHSIIPYQNCSIAIKSVFITLSLYYMYLVSCLELCRFLTTFLFSFSLQVFPTVTAHVVVHNPLLWSFPVILVGRLP